MNNRQLISFIRIGGTTVPVLSWQAHLTSYGNLCSFEARTSIKQMKDNYPDIFSDALNNFNFECQIILQDNTNQNSQIVFDGIVDTLEGVWEQDILEITGRDYSAILRDQDATLDKYVNMTIPQVVQGIIDLANQNLLPDQITSVITSSSQIAGIRASTFQGEDWALSTHPTAMWNVIQKLADEVGFVAYMDQHKTLHFEQPASGKTTHTYYWRPTGPSAENPILNLEIMQQARRCSNFTLRVHGYDSSGKETIYKDVTRGSGSGHFYNRTRQDLDANNYVQIANNLADEIERKTLVVKMTVEGNTDLNVNDPVQVLQSEKGDLLGLDNRQLFIVGLMHSFEMPDYGSEEAAGFLTHITCNQATSNSD